MKLTTPVSITPSARQLTHDRPVLLLGSCFTDEIGTRLLQSGFQVLCNPFGTLYNPLSIAACLQRALHPMPFTHDCLVQRDGLYHSWYHHGCFSSPNADEVLQRCNLALDRTHDFLALGPVVIITFGTAYAFILHDPASPMNGKVVANCHKLPACNFERIRLDIDTIVDTFQPLAAQLSPIFTVSPIRHLADGLHGNQLSKAILHLAVEQLCQQGGEYFPSYEIVVDELRDYRFYARDLCHPSDLAVDIIYHYFQHTYMSDATRQRCAECEKQYRQSQHRPIHIL